MGCGGEEGWEGLGGGGCEGVWWKGGGIGGVKRESI